MKINLNVINVDSPQIFRHIVRFLKHQQTCKNTNFNVLEGIIKITLNEIY